MKGYIEYINPISLDNGPGIRFTISTKSKKLEITSSYLHQKITKYRHYLLDGGVTIVDIDLDQIEFITDLLRRCKMTNINTCIITNKKITDENLLKYVDIIETKKV